MIPTTAVFRISPVFRKAFKIGGIYWVVKLYELYLVTKRVVSHRFVILNVHLHSQYEVTHRDEDCGNQDLRISRIDQDFINYSLLRDVDLFFLNSFQSAVPGAIKRAV